MIRDIEALGVPSLRADICIVGAGAAGITLAHQFVDAPLRTVVLESGRRKPEARTQSLYESHVVGLSHGGIHSLRARTFGGTTTRWAGQALPLSAFDFGARDWVPLSGWPWSREELDPYYAQASDLMCIPRFPVEGAEWWPAVLPPAPAFDPKLLESSFSEFTGRPDFAAVYGASLEASRNVDLILGANVTELIPDVTASAVERATVRSLRGQELCVESDVFVVCAGGIETARVLLASNRRCAGGLGNAHDLVGRCFQDHPGFIVGPIVTEDAEGLRQAFRPRRVGSVKFAPRFGASATLQRREHLLNAGGAVVFDASQDGVLAAGKTLVRAVRQRRPGRGALTAARLVARNPGPVVSAGLRHFLLNEPALDTTVTPVLGIGCEQMPNLESRVYLSDDRDVLGMPRTVLDWRLTTHEIAASRRIAEVAATEFERLGLGRIDLSEFSLPDDPAALSGQVIDAGHHMGTARMAVSARRGVVDPNCRVHGLDNLYVASTAVFPTGGTSNPTFTLLAICLRLAERLRDELARDRR